MSEYEVRKTRHGKWGVYMPNGGILDSFITEQKAKNRADILNRGNAPLHATIEAQRQRIAELEAANAKAMELLSLLHGMDYTQEAKDYLMADSDYANYAIVTDGIEWLNQQKQIAGDAQPTPTAAPVADAPVPDEQGGDHWWRFTDTNALEKALAVAKPAPRFKVGDKVLAAKLVAPLPVTKLVWHRGEWCYELDNRAVFWRESELEAYSESEGE